MGRVIEEGGEGLRLGGDCFSWVKKDVVGVFSANEVRWSRLELVLGGMGWEFGMELWDGMGWDGMVEGGRW